MSDDDLFVHIDYGGGSKTCRCRCPDGPCEHEWDGWEEWEDPDTGCSGGSQVCSRCGMSAMSHDMRVGP